MQPSSSRIHILLHSNNQAASNGCFAAARSSGDISRAHGSSLSPTKWIVNFLLVMNKTWQSWSFVAPLDVASKDGQSVFNHMKKQLRLIELHTAATWTDTGCSLPSHLLIHSTAFRKPHLSMLLANKVEEEPILFV
jgi:hypothetical protein